MTIIAQLQTLQDTISALKTVIEAHGCDVEDTAGLTDITSAINEKLNYINNRLIGITGTNRGRVNHEAEYKQDLDDINTTLTNLGVTAPAKYEDIDDTILASYTEIYNHLNNILGEVPIDDSQTAQIEQLTSNLDDIKDVLTGLGLTVTDDYSDLATIIQNSFNDILSQIQELNGEDNE